MGEDVGCGGFGVPDHMGADAEGDRRISVAKAGCDDVDRYPGEQQGRGVDMPQVVDGLDRGRACPLIREFRSKGGGGADAGPAVALAFQRLSR